MALRTRPRIVSLLPSATEIVCALGLRDCLVGVSHECDHPAAVRGLPAVTAPKLDVAGSSAEIDRSLRVLVESGLGVYRVDAALLAALAPDLILTQDQCEVCAVSYRDVLRATRDVAGGHVEILSLRPRRLADVWDDVERVAAAAGVLERGHAAAERLRDRVTALAERTRPLPRPRLACLEWLDPLMAAGNWVPDLAAAAGAAYDLATPGEHSAWLAWEGLEASRAEVLCALPCGFSLARTHRELAGLLREPRWHVLPAVRADRVFALDGSAYFNRPGPRLAESAEILAAVLHPEELADLLRPGAWSRVRTTSTGEAIAAAGD
jgi:iron complex transport system substrate-binding protein